MPQLYKLNTFIGAREHHRLWQANHIDSLRFLILPPHRSEPWQLWWWAPAATDSKCHFRACFFYGSCSWFTDHSRQTTPYQGLEWPGATNLVSFSFLELLQDQFKQPAQQMSSAGCITILYSVDWKFLPYINKSRRRTLTMHEHSLMVVIAGSTRASRHCWRPVCCTSSETPEALTKSWVTQQ
jgi:hypothetical protein